MNKVILAISFCIASVSSSAFAGAYVCKSYGSSVCAVNLVTGQCTHSWRSGESQDPLYECRQFTSEVSTRVDRSRLYCAETANGACAVNSLTGQCTQSWRHGDDQNPMASCQRYLNRGGKRPDRTGYYCRQVGSSYCAVNPRTNQCTHSWRMSDGDARRSCQRFIGR